MRFGARSIENKPFILAGALLAALALAPATPAQTAAAQTAAKTSSPGSTQTSAPASTRDRWLHVRVTNPDSREETVRVNVPLELAEKVLPAINKDRVHGGKVRIEDVDCHGVDIHALLDALRTSRDGEFVTVQNHDSDVRVAKQNGYMFVHVYEKDRPKQSEVEVKIPMKVVDALFSAGKDELDLVAGLRALAAQGDTELVSVKDRENSVRVWLDSKNVSN
jgi:hypothetical protein